MFTLPVLVQRNQNNPTDLIITEVSLDTVETFFTLVKDQPIGLDVETSGHPIGHADYCLKTIQVGVREVVVVFDASDTTQVNLAAKILDSAPLIIAHSATADIIPTAIKAGRASAGWWAKTVDTMVLASLHPKKITGDRVGLKALSAHVLGDLALSPIMDSQRKKLFTKNHWVSDISTDTLIEKNGWINVDIWDSIMVGYAAADVFDALELYYRLPDLAPELIVREMQVVKLCAGISEHGLMVDSEAVDTLSETLVTDISKAQKTLSTYGVNNPNSSAELGRVLTSIGAQLPRTATGKPSTAAGVLENLAHDTDPTISEFCHTVLSHRKATKLQSTFINVMRRALDGDGCIRPTILTLGARETGRMSCVRPNFQQLPKTGGVRECLQAPDGYTIISADFSGIELRVAAAISEDTILAKKIRDGADIHMEIAQLAFGKNATKLQRGLAKAVVFGKIYGAGKSQIEKSLGEHYSAADRVIAAIEQVTPRLFQWSRALTNAVKTGRVSCWAHPSGRVTYFDPEAPFKATNYVIQSTAREVLVDAMLKWGHTKWGSQPLIPVHDELLIVVPEEDGDEATKTLIDCMETVLAPGRDWFVPVVVEADPPSRNWKGM